MAMKLGKLFDVKVFYATVSDDQEGDQIATLGLVPALRRVIVISKSRVEKAQSGGSAFGTLPKELETEFIRRVAPDLLEPGQVPVPGTESPSDAPRPNPGIPAKLKGR